jgi:hypothetical protein
MSAYTIWITALTGGLAAALLTLLGQSLLRWWNRPILEIVFRNEPGCRVPLEGIFFLNKETHEVLRDEHGNPRRGNVLYLRLKIENRGKTFAKTHQFASLRSITKPLAQAGSRSQRRCLSLSWLRRP